MFKKKMLIETAKGNYIVSGEHAYTKIRGDYLSPPPQAEIIFVNKT